MREELVAVRAEFATPRRTLVAPAADGIDDEDLIEREEMVVTVTLDGYIKRTPLDTFRAQRRGGKGRAGMATKDEDVVTELFVTSTHTPVLFFSTLGKVYRMKVWRSEEHPSDLQSLMRNSYAVFCLKKKTTRLQSDVHESTNITTSRQQ